MNINNKYPFEEGDIISGKEESTYIVTDRRMRLAKVEDASGSIMSIKILKHDTPSYVGKEYHIYNSLEDFNFVESVNKISELILELYCLRDKLVTLEMDVPFQAKARDSIDRAIGNLETNAGGF